MGTNRIKSIPIAEIAGAVAAVSLLCIQLFWSKEDAPELRKGIEVIFLTMVAITSVLLVTKAKKTTKSVITLKSVEDSDIQQLETWLNKAHILKWYHDPDEWLNEIKKRNGSFGFLHHFIVLKNDIPIGFGQYYDCFDAKEEWYIVSQPNQMFSIDYFIGEEEYLRKGFGKETVKLLTQKIWTLNPNAQIVVQPENENIASCKALLANGYVYNEEKNYFLLNK